MRIHGVRCMHDVPPVVWDADVYNDCYATFKDQAAMEHSDCYGVKAPAGPAGENLFKASYNDPLYPILFIIILSSGIAFLYVILHALLHVSLHHFLHLFPLLLLVL